MKTICVTEDTVAAFTKMGAATKQATVAIKEFCAVMLQHSKYLPKTDRRRIGRMIRRGKIVRNGKVTLA